VDSSWQFFLHFRNSYDTTVQESACGSSVGRETTQNIRGSQRVRGLRISTLGDLYLRQVP